MNTPEQDKYIMTSLDKALKVIDILSEHPNSSIASLTKLTDYGKSSLFKILYTLEDNGFVTKDDHATYSLSLKFTRYGIDVMESMDTLKTVHPHVAELNKEINETVHFSVLSEDRHHVVVLDKVNSNHNIQMGSKIGKYLPLHCTGTGKAILSKMPDGEIEATLREIDMPAFTTTTITDKAQMWEEIAVIRRQGYAVDNEESEYGLTCYATAVTGLNGQIIGAISISGATYRMQLNKELYIKKLLQAQENLSSTFSY